MPGIVGFITSMPRERAERELLRMVESIRHESFYATGTWIDESLGVYVGWTTQQGSFSDGMPVQNERGDLTLVFSGEDFPASGAARRHESNEHRPQPAAYLAQLAEGNPTFPRELNGKFHGLLADQASGIVTLFNDRYGMHRLYYHEAKDAFYFAAEAKAILAVRPELRRADPRGLGELVACGCVLGDRTLFPELHVLPSASAWEFRGKALQQKKPYFDPAEWENQSRLDPEAYYRELRDTFSRNLGRYFSGDQAVGIALTGGLDTRAIMAWRSASTDPLACYTFGGTYRECEDVRIARKVATLSGKPHSVIAVGKAFLSRFSHYAERSIYLTDGCVDLTRSPDLYVSEQARQIAPVKVVGTFGSEILRQLAIFKPVEPTPGLFRPEFVSQMRRAGQTYAGLRQGRPLSFSVFRQSPWYLYGVFALEQSQLTVRAPYLDNDFVRTVFRASDSALGDDVRLRLIADGSAALGALRSDRGIGGLKGPMAALVRNYLEFTFKAEYAYDYGMPQWVAGIDHAFSAFQLERIFLGRHKLFHFRVWYRDALADYVKAMLLDSRSLSRPYLERKGVERIVQGHLKGNCNYTTEIHKLLTLELVHRLFVDAA